VPLSLEWLDAAIGGMLIIIARSGGRVVGYAVSSTLADQSDDPILNGMLQAYPGSPGCYIYGPICVAASERGKGVARAMVGALRAQLPGREGFTFIRADNAVSRKVHASMGMREAGHFTVEGVGYVVVAYVG
jgi:predicted GNAT superfamily acetyltransferase